MTSVDLARFRWIENEEDPEDGEVGDKEEDRDSTEEDYQGGGEYDNVEIPQYGRVVITAVTIWIGVLPNTLKAEEAYNSSNKILNLLIQHGITGIEVAYRESVVKDFAGLPLFAPVDYRHPFRGIIDFATTALGLPIAGLATPNTQGTLGFYFRVDQDLFAVTARHNIFPKDSITSYSYVGMFFSL